MPTLCRFDGIQIRMYWGEREHPPPHFHAFRAGEVLIVNIQDLTIRESSASAATERRVVEWANKRQNELLDNWDRLQQHQAIKPIDP